MATAHASSATIQFTVWDISALSSVWSPKVSLYGMPFQIEVQKIQNRTQKSLGVYLYCDGKKNTCNWSVTAWATIKLLPFNARQQAFEYNISPYVYDRTTGGYGTCTMIYWNQLFNRFKKYVNNDSIRLEVNIEAQNPYNVYRSFAEIWCIDQSCECCCQANYQMTVSNVSGLMAVRSNPFFMRDMPWNLLISKDDSHLKICLSPQQDGEIVPQNIQMTVKLMSFKRNVNPIQRAGGTNPIEMISWTELMTRNSKYVSNNTITLYIEINTNDMSGNISNADSNGAVQPYQYQCSICLEGLGGQDTSITPCGHGFCSACITRAVRNDNACPLCKKRVHLGDLRRMYLTA